MAVALVRAAGRLGKDTRVLTTSNGRIKRGFPFIDVKSNFSPPSDRSIEFVDLKSQQDRIRPQLEERLYRVLHHGYYVMGPEITQLEERLAQYVGVEHCICVSSGTDALLIAMMGLELKPGDEVITSPFSFFATGEMIALLGAKAVYVDIDPKTFNIDPSQIEIAISDRTRAILPISLFGQCADMDAINGIAQRYGLAVIHDAAQSFGATYKGRNSCALSTITCTSFFPSKPLGAYGDAGACFTNDDDLAVILRQVRNHGQNWRYHHIQLGINGRMDSLQAAVLLAKFDIFQEELEKRQAVADCYTEKLTEYERNGFLVLPKIHPDNTSSWAQYTLRVGSRETIQAELGEHRIPTAIHYPVLLYEQPVLAQSFIDCPESACASKEVLSLPMHPYLDRDTQGRITDALANALTVSDDPARTSS
jgi:UDP-2-acetamido-2-deoxy-ribo-hexuluronate aminotransferase